MKATVVPAQVTTVEDRVAGSLGFAQLILFAIPVFGGSLLYAALPPSMGGSLYKLVVIGIITTICSILAIRIKGKIVLLWAIVLLRYKLRPRLYLFSKNTDRYREDYPEASVASTQPEAEVKQLQSLATIPKLGYADTARAYATLDNPLRHLRYETTKKGGLHVRYTEIEDSNE